MGLVYTDIELANASDGSLLPMTVRALVDTGAVHLCIPEHVALQLKLPVLEEREVTVADGQRVKASYAGPVRIRFQNRQCLVGALVMGDEPLLGAIPMEDMDILVHPTSRQVVVNPQSPNIAMSIAKGVRPGSKREQN